VKPAEEKCVSFKLKVFLNIWRWWR